MHQQFLNNANLSLMTSDELREIFGDDDKLDERVDELVSEIFFVFLKIF